MIHPRRDVPIDGPDIISRLVFAHLVEIHPLALEDAVILARQRLAHEAVGANLNLPDLLEDLARNHSYGTGRLIKDLL